MWSNININMLLEVIHKKGGEKMNIRRKEEGFTIIEVVLVLAIAALIFLMVFIALPGLQRSQRDTQRRSDLSRLVTAVASYQSNNKGKIPGFTGGAGVTTWDGDFKVKYMKSASHEFDDPAGNGYVLKAGTVGMNIPEYAETVTDIYVTTKAVCDGEKTVNSSDRKVAFQIALEGGGVACVNN